MSWNPEQQQQSFSWEKQIRLQMTWAWNWSITEWGILSALEPLGGVKPETCNSNPMCSNHEENAFEQSKGSVGEGSAEHSILQSSQKNPGAQFRTHMWGIYTIWKETSTPQNELDPEFSTLQYTTHSPSASCTMTLIVAREWSNSFLLMMVSSSAPLRTTGCSPCASTRSHPVARNIRTYINKQNISSSPHLLKSWQSLYFFRPITYENQYRYFF